MSNKVLKASNYGDFCTKTNKYFPTWVKIIKAHKTILYARLGSEILGLMKLPASSWEKDQRIDSISQSTLQHQQLN